eukprot:scaffold40774_cov72-Phaeocystis_antarctica.AAC.2
MQAGDAADGRREGVGVEVRQRLLGVRGERTQYSGRVLQPLPLAGLARQPAQCAPRKAEA